jgi:serine phosphatase RsbU (regulator of sigma subunit)
VTGSLRRPRWPYSLAIGVVLAGLLVTGALTWVSASTYRNNERRLLDLRVKELGSVLGSAAVNIQTPLASAAALADATNGDPRKFRHLVGPEVGTPPGHQFVSVSLWRLGAAARGPTVAVGTPPALAGSPSRIQAYFDGASRTKKVSIIGLLDRPQPRLGYALTTRGASRRYAVYGEGLLPADRRSRLQSNSAFSDLDYALFLGRSPLPRELLVTSLAKLPIRGRQAQEPIPFGDSVLTLVVSARRPLGGSFPQRLPWIIVIAGILLSLGAGALTVRLIQRRRGAEDLAGRLEGALEENQQLYAEQRNIAQTLQHALLPDELPDLAGAETSGRYEPGEQGMEIGGDWYDVIPAGDQRLLVVVGDVSGHGLAAAATMASLRYAIHAYAAQNDPPATILTKLSSLLTVTTSRQLATVLCALVDLESRKLTVTSAGHLPPLLISDGHGEYVGGEVGLPIGVENDVAYVSTTVAVPPAATFLAFTDGLVERRGEALDQGLARLRDAAVTDDLALPELLATIVAELRHGPAEDDTAIVGVRWTD